MEEDEEVLGTPSFQVLLRDGKPLVSGCYFMNPIIEVRDAQWDADRPGRLVVTASDGSRWYSDAPPAEGTHSVELTEIAPVADRSITFRTADVQD